MGLRDKYAKKIEEQGFQPLDLSEGNVQTIFNAIFNRCGKLKEDGSVEWNVEALNKNRANICYLLGQLTLVHEGVKEHELDGAFAKKYDGNNWTTDSSILINLLMLGNTSGSFDLFKKDGKQFIQLNLNNLRPTLSPKDPKFTAWCDGADVLMIKALAAQSEDKQEEALSFYLKAAEQGDADAQFYAALMYDSGKGTAKNKAEALKWYLKAAEQGDAMAQYSVGAAYFDGAGTARDRVKAKIWFEKAAAQGNYDAKEALRKYF